MNELDIINALSDKEPRRQAALEFLKTSGVADMGKALAEWASKGLKANAPEIGAALGGAALTGAAQYLMARPRKGGLSIDQAGSGAALRAQKLMESEAKRDGRQLTYREEMQKAMVPALKGVADASAKYPGKSALMAASSGSLAGLALLKALT
jgi:hypothetical protein